MTEQRFPPLPKNHTPVRWFRMEQTNDREAEVYIYDVIDSWWGVNASDFVRELADLDVDVINLRVNSPGGSIYDGVAMMNALRRHKARVVATVDGLAASAASFIIQAADEIVMGRGSELMIHDGSSFAWGTAAELRAESELIDRLSNTIAGIYAERAGGTQESWREAMLAETWYTDSEAVAAGLADRVDATASEDSAATNRFDLSTFAHNGRANAPAPALAAAQDRPRGPRAVSLDAGRCLPQAVHLVAQATTTSPPAEPGGSTTTNQEGSDAMSDKLTSGLLELLGRKAEDNLTDEALLGLVEDQLTAPANTTSTTPPAGTRLVDETQFASLVADAQAGREAREHQRTTARTAAVDAAVNDGRIAPARKDHWLKALEADDGALETLNNLTPGLVPLEAKGHTGGVDEASDEDAQMYAKFWGDPDTKKGA
jgi:ATP-dependent protease ClpP protease subunit